MLKYTIVPEAFFEKDQANTILSQAVQLDENDRVTYQELPEYKAVLVYAGKLPKIAELIKALPNLTDFNRLAAAFDGRIIDIALALGDDLKIANSYTATDETTAEYFILSVLKRFQVNPKVTIINFSGEIPFKLHNDLFRIFKGVEKL